jgi:hypothetical protein
MGSKGDIKMIRQKQLFIVDPQRRDMSYSEEHGQIS